MGNPQEEEKGRIKARKLKSECLQMTLSPNTRRFRNQHSMAFQVLSASLKAINVVSFPDSLNSFAEMSDDCMSKFASFVRASD